MLAPTAYPASSLSLVLNGCGRGEETGAAVASCGGRRADGAAGAGVSAHACSRSTYSAGVRQYAGRLGRYRAA